MLTSIRPTRDMLSELLAGAGGGARRAGAAVEDPQVRKARQFSELLDRMLALDPAKRISLRDALHHPFILEPFT